MGLIDKVRNYVFPVKPVAAPLASKEAQRNLSNTIMRVQFERIRQDVMSWRDAIKEAEQAYYPHRVKMQRLFIDTALNGHVDACMQRRKDLTLLRDFHFCDEAGNTDENITNLMQEPWFYQFINYSLDALFYGYSLISLGDVVEDRFPNLSIVRRWNVSPDRYNVTSYVYSLSGTPFLEGEAADWHIYAATPTDTGVSPCGYGLLYKVAVYEIFLRNLLGFNGDFVELYAQPYRVGKTSKTDENERAVFEAALRDMGSAGYALIDESDSISFIETALGGTGYKGYESLEARCEKKISKIILGHADALDSVPGKLGASQGDDNPVAVALRDKQTTDGRYVQYIVNSELLPRLRKLGFVIPDGIRFAFKNDAEVMAGRLGEDEANKKTAEVLQVLSQAGYAVPSEWIEERTGIPVEPKPQPQPAPPPISLPSNAKEFSNSIKNKLENLYK